MKILALLPLISVIANADDRFLDKDRVNSLSYLEARYYSPYLGRFLTQDIKKALSSGYSYTSGNPIMNSDPTGLMPRSLYQELIEATLENEHRISESRYFSEKENTVKVKHRSSKDSATKVANKSHIAGATVNHPPHVGYGDSDWAKTPKLGKYRKPPGVFDAFASKSKDFVKSSLSLGGEIPSTLGKMAVKSKDLAVGLGSKIKGIPDAIGEKLIDASPMGTLYRASDWGRAEQRTRDYDAELYKYKKHLGSTYDDVMKDLPSDSDSD